MCLDAKTNSIHLFKQPQNISVIFCQKCVGFLFFFKGEKNRCSVWRKGPALLVSVVVLAEHFPVQCADCDAAPPHATMAVNDRLFRKLHSS